ncbi:RING/U-box superfamily protein [Striga asiatica]|uniref:RING-type E3 ubiquitin transferase n=1 Tax=Striga asiatica TaxID=4170 RepID=A0A5A7P2F3_STRAF|nr:RING/U-box superfamily protein [Striga asiatica]
MPMNQNRPRVIVNGVHRTRTYHYYWCRECQRSLRTTTTNPSEILCPRCLRQIRLELDVSRPGPLLARPQPPPVLDSLAQALDPNPNQPNPSPRPANRAWILLQFIGPEGSGNNIQPFGPVDPNQQLIQEQTQNNRPGPIPAPDTAIRALPLVELTEEHLKNDTCCPVCKDEFAIGVKVRELECKHFYHSECIVPWLRINNTCPVCRHEVGGILPSNNENNNNDNNNNFGDYYNYVFEDFHYGDQQEGSWSYYSEQNWSWTEVFSLRPFNLVLSFAQLCIDFLDGRVSNVSRGGLYFGGTLCAAYRDLAIEATKGNLL